MRVRNTSAAGQGRYTPASVLSRGGQNLEHEPAHIRFDDESAEGSAFLSCQKEHRQRHGLARLQRLPTRIPAASNARPPAHTQTQTHTNITSFKICQSASSLHGEHSPELHGAEEN